MGANLHLANRATERCGMELKSPAQTAEPHLTLEWGDEGPTTATLTIPMDGAMAGYTCHIPYRLDGGRIYHGPITYDPGEWRELDAAPTNRALRDLRLGDMRATLETCLRHVARLGVGQEWLDACRAGRRRAGRAGNADLYYAIVSQRRIEAEERAPGNAIRYMVKTWPGDGPTEFVSEKAADKKVYRAKVKGMHERTPDGLRLTEKARRLLEGGSE